MEKMRSGPISRPEPRAAKELQRLFNSQPSGSQTAVPGPATAWEPVGRANPRTHSDLLGQHSGVGPGLQVVLLSGKHCPRLLRKDKGATGLPGNLRLGRESQGQLMLWRLWNIQLPGFTRGEKEIKKERW